MPSKYLLFLLFGFINFSTLFSMNEETDTQEKNISSLNEIIIKKCLSQEDEKYVSEEEFFTMAQAHIEKPYSIMKGGVGTTLSYRTNKAGKSYQSNHTIYFSHKVLTVYISTHDGEQKAFMGTPNTFFDFERFINKPIAVAVAILHSRKKKNYISGKMFTLEDLFSQISSKLDINNLKKYWIQSSHEYPQSVATILKPDNKSYMLLEDGQTINFHNS